MEYLENICVRKNPNPIWKNYLRSRDKTCARCKLCHKVIKYSDFTEITNKNKKISSTVWQAFLRSKNKHLAKCKFCHSVLKVHGTSSLRRHLEKKHDIREEIENIFCYVEAEDKCSENEEDKESSDEEKSKTRKKTSKENKKARDTPNKVDSDGLNDLPFAKYKGNSVVWEYFLRSDDSLRSYAKCTICERILKCDAGSTSTLKKHLLGVHKIS